MVQEARVPANLFEQIDQRIQQRAQEVVASILRSATISGGAGLSIKDGGVLRLVTADGVELFYIGPLGPEFPDGRPQQGWAVRRADGTGVLDLMDIDVSDGVARQALNWRDRAGNVVLADDTDSGQGVARPYLSGGFSRTRFADMSVSTTAAAFETLWDTRVTKQQPTLEIWYRASMDTAATTGEVRVLVNGQPFGAAQSVGFAVGTQFIGPLPVAGDHMSTLLVEIQGRRTSASGALRVEPLTWFGRQT